MTSRLFVTDLDGTLLGPEGQVRPIDEQAVRALQAQGILVALCTGRLYSGTRSIAQQLGIVSPVACADGCQIVDPLSHAPLQTSPLGPKDLAVIGKHVHDAPVALFAFAEDQILYDRQVPAFVDAVRPWSTQMRYLPELREVEIWSGLTEVVAIVALGSREQVATSLRACARPLAGRVRASAFALRGRSQPPLWAFVLRQHGIDKASALRWLAQHHGIQLKDVLAVGDWVNDIPMLRTAGLSYAMGHATREIWSTATERLDATVWTGGGIAESARRAGWL